MTPDQRTALLAKMCELYSDKIRHFPQDYVMSEVLTLAERIITIENTTETERALGFIRSSPGDKHDAVLNLIIQWLREDVPRPVRPALTADICHALARKLSFLEP